MVVNVASIKFAVCDQAVSYSRMIFCNSSVGFFSRTTWCTSLWSKSLLYYALIVTPHDENQHESLCLNFKTCLPWSCQLTALSWIVCVVEAPCSTTLCWTTLTVERNSAPISWHRSLFSLEMYFSPVQTSADILQTQQHSVPSGQSLTSLEPTRHSLSSTVSVHG